MTSGQETWERCEKLSHHGYEQGCRVVCLACIDAALVATMELAAGIADEWAYSRTCDPSGSACEHIRTAAEIAARIRQQIYKSARTCR